MSMHDVEDLMEQAARLLDRTDYPNLRPLYAGLFDDFGRLPVIDVKFVGYAVRDLLVRHRYAYRTDAGNPVYDALGKRDGTSVYAFSGDALWKRLIADNVLTGNDAQPPRLTLADPLVLTRLVLTEAEKDGDSDFIVRWYAALLIWLQFSTDDRELLEVAANPLLQEIMRIVARNDGSTPPRGFSLSDYFVGELPLTPEAFVHGTLEARRGAE